LFRLTPLLTTGEFAILINFHRNEEYRLFPERGKKLTEGVETTPGGVQLKKKAELSIKSQLLSITYLTDRRLFALLNG
jgi:hypothetical protein